VERKANVGGKGSYPLSSMMTQLNYLMEAPSSCDPDNANVAAFVVVTSIIGGCDAVKEFLSFCGLSVKSLALKWKRRSLPHQKLWCRCHKSLPLLGC
jgi:hypothetical protein